MRYHKHGANIYGTARHFNFANKVEIVLCTGHGKIGIGVCIKRGSQWRNRWVFFDGRGVGFVGW